MATLQPTSQYIFVRLRSPCKLKQDIIGVQSIKRLNNSCKSHHVWQQRGKLRTVLPNQSHVTCTFSSDSSNKGSGDDYKIAQPPGSYIHLQKSSTWSKLKVAVEPVLKSIAAVNSDIRQKVVSELEHFAPTVITKRQKPTPDLHRPESLDKRKSEDSSRNKKKYVSRSYIYEDSSIKREQHNFGEAMSHIHDSINTYFKGMGSGKRVSEKVPSIPKYSRASVSHEHATNEKTQKLASAEEGKESSGIVKRMEPYVDKVIEILPAEYRRRLDISSAQKVVLKKNTLSRAKIKSRMRAIVASVKSATSHSSRLVRMEELSKHLLLYPQANAVAYKENIVPYLLKMREMSDKAISGQARECLALVGYVDPLTTRGIRILTIDGGGTRGLVSINMLKLLQKKANREIHELFDYICGVSTGALIAVMLGCYQVPLDECERVYKKFSLEMFQRNTIVGASKLVLNHAFYDTEVWTNILRNNIGERTLIDTARNPASLKLAAASCIVNCPNIQNYMFRNYNLPPGVQSHYAGSCQHKVWEAIRASSAAPGYYEEFRLDDLVHQDGGLLTNNPTALAIHECRLLWPDEPLQCVVSLGNGRYEPTDDADPGAYTSIKGKIVKFVQSATDVHAVHTMLTDLLPPSTYFRFNPHMSEEYLLDEIREEKLTQLQQDCEMYLRKNEHKMEMASQQLLLPRRWDQKLFDFSMARINKYH